MWHQLLNAAVKSFSRLNIGWFDSGWEWCQLLNDQLNKTKQKNLSNKTYQTKPTKPNSWSQTKLTQTNPTTKLNKQDLPHRIYKNKHTKWNLQNQTYQSKLTKPNENYQIKTLEQNLPNQSYQFKPTESNIPNQTYEPGLAKLILEFLIEFIHSRK